MKNREKFSSRLGFILISAGCAVGLGNVWRFPYIVGKYGGAAFVLLYLFFLVILGLPIMTMEFAVGRASGQSAARSFDILEPKGSKWHFFKYFAISGNYLLMMFYTTIGGWMMNYFFKMLKGDFINQTTQQVNDIFVTMTQNPTEMVFWMAVTILIGMMIVSFGLKNGVEKISKFMMTSLFAIMLILVVRSVTLPNASAGLAFYLKPDFTKMFESDFAEVVFAAMGQAFFTLSLGIGALAIFGSYLDKDRSLMGESISITILDTLVAFISGLIIFPACFAFNVAPDSGPNLVFVTLPNIFNNMALGNIWGALFFLFMSFAAMTTIIAVFENIIAFGIELWGWSRKKSVLINLVLITILSLPCALGFNLLSDWQIIGKGVLDFEDFLVSNNLLPLGSLVYLLFCVTRYGWGWDNFIQEVNTGKGIKFPTAIRYYLVYILPLIVLYIFVQGYINL